MPTPFSSPLTKIMRMGSVVKGATDATSYRQS